MQAHAAILRPARVVDLGCGEGFVAERLQALPFSFEYRGLELREQAVDQARARVPGLDFRVADAIATEPDRGWAELAISLEVLEHLPRPELLVERLAQWSSRYVIVSVPHEPYFRLGNLLRGKYLGSLGNHPEHVQQFTPASLRALLQPHFESVAVESAFPWLIAVARKGAA